MAYTKADIRGLVKTEVLTYLPTIRLDPRTIDLNVHRAEMDVYRFITQLTAYENVFFYSTSVGDGDDFPVRFDFQSNVATTSENIPATYIDIQEVGFRNTNIYDLATEDSPSYAYCNQKIVIFPNTVTLEFGHYKTPTDFSSPSVLDTTESDIPDELSGLVTLAAAKYCMQTLVRYADQFGLSDADKKNAQMAIEIFGNQYQYQQQLETKLL